MPQAACHMWELESGASYLSMNGRRGGGLSGMYELRILRLICQLLPSSCNSRVKGLHAGYAASGGQSLRRLEERLAGFPLYLLFLVPTNSNAFLPRQHVML